MEENLRYLFGMLKSKRSVERSKVMEKIRKQTIPDDDRIAVFEVELPESDIDEEHRKRLENARKHGYDINTFPEVHTLGTIPPERIKRYTIRDRYKGFGE